ncbi:MAG: S9 family peptidase, partial [Thermoplasmata archaeon]|nr:S9 family peptidase [Thermoplasmata archaeon]
MSSQRIRYPTFDGREIEAILYSPRSIPAGVRLPAIMEVHGGPTAQFFEGFDPLAQYLVSQGFVLLRPNIRGSTGYGPAFRDL